MSGVKTVSILLSILATAFSNVYLVDSDVVVADGSDGDEWVYYGFSPWVNYTPPEIITRTMTINNATWLVVIGYNDSTKVTVYDVTGGGHKVLESFTVDRMKAHAMKLLIEGYFSIETFFKVVSHKPVAVRMSGGLFQINGGNVFYPSTDGGFAGKEFIVMTAPAGGAGRDYIAFAIEDSTIEIRDKNDKIVRKLNVAANSSKRLELFMDRIYRIVSTGRSMISSWVSSGFTVCPNPTGGYSGRLFFASPYQTALYGSPILLITPQERPTQVEVHDVGTDSLIVERSLGPREMWFINREVADLEGVRLMVRSDGEVIVYAGATLLQEGVSDSPGQIAKGIAFVTVRADRPTTIFSVSDAFVFSPNGGAEIRINGLTITVPRDSYKNIPAGQITVTSNKTVIIQSISVVNYYEYARTFYQPAGLRSFSAYLLPANRLEVTYPPPKTGEAEPAGGYGLDLMLVAAVAGAAAILVGVLILKKRS